MDQLTFTIISVGSIMGLLVFTIWASERVRKRQNLREDKQ